MASHTRLTLIFIINILKQIHGYGGVFELGLDSLTNDFGLSEDSQCCRGFRTNNGPCSSTCRTFFTVCLKEYQTNIVLDEPCTFGMLRTPVLGDNSFKVPDGVTNSSYVNPLAIPFDFSWPGSFTLIVTAWHDKSTTQRLSDDSPRAVVARMSIRRHLKVSRTWTSQTYHSEKTDTVLKLSYRVRCPDSYYGESCSHQCHPRDDTLGHYRCSENGTKICLDQWTGKYCDKPVCLTGCHKENGFCDSPNECRCRKGWEGELCDRCTRYPGCKHGTCQQAFQCICLSGWGGQFCDQDLNYCTHHSPCQNGATCKNTGAGSFSCSCLPGFYGDTCEHKAPECNENGRPCENECLADPCRNGGSCIDEVNGYRCICKTGYRGQNCEVDIDDCATNPCKNGGICQDQVAGFKCDCARGWVGPLCQENVDECQMQPCANNGTCEDLVDGFRCTCTAGFAGPDCSMNVDDCKPSPCRNQGLCKDLIDDYYCECRSGFTGRDCETVADFTAVEPRREPGHGDDGLTLKHVIIIVCAGVGLPILLILLVVLVLLLRRRNHDRHNDVITNDMNKDHAKSLNNDKWRKKSSTKPNPTDNLNIIPTGSVCVKINNKITQQTLHSISEKEKNYIEKDINTVDGQLQNRRHYRPKYKIDKHCNVSNHAKTDNDTADQSSVDSAYPSQLQVVTVDESSAVSRSEPDLKEKTIHLGLQSESSSWSSDDDNTAQGQTRSHSLNSDHDSISPYYQATQV